MNRRVFIEKTIILGSAACLPLPAYSMFAKPKYKMGLQLYSINENMMKEPLATLKAAKAMGYEDFETLGLIVKKVLFTGIKLQISGRYWKI